MGQLGIPAQNKPVGKVRKVWGKQVRIMAYKVLGMRVLDREVGKVLGMRVLDMQEDRV